MLKYTVISFGLFLSSLAYGADSSAVKKPEPPVRYFDKIGNRLAPQTIQIIHEMDCDPNGWRFNAQEWRMMKDGGMILPRYYKDPEHGSNGGWELT